jgi:hypothetical protein
MGEWLTVNGESIYGTAPGPAPYDIGGLRMTMRDRRLYIHLSVWGEGSVRLPALGSNVESCRLPACPGARVTVEPGRSSTGDEWLVIHLPAETAGMMHPVLALDLDAPPVIERRVHAEADGVIRLPVHLAEQALAGDDRINILGIAAPWREAATRFSWEIPVEEPGIYDVVLEANVAVCRGEETGPYKLVVILDDALRREGEIPRLYELSDRDGHANQDRRYRLCDVPIDDAGRHRIALELAEPVPTEDPPIPLTSLRLCRQPQLSAANRRGKGDEV